MKTKLVFIVTILLFSVIKISAQVTAPVVSNVTFTIINGIVDIYYDLYDAENDPMTVHMMVSNDGGLHFGYSCIQITGDVGSGITSGTGKHIIWNFNFEHPNESGDNFVIRIIAGDGVSDGPPCPGIPTVDYDGKIYHTVQIGNQCWLKENLNIGTRISTFQNMVSGNGIEKYCYADNEANCDIYGGLYQWNEAIQYVNVQGTRGICPVGWHIPTFLEQRALAYAVNENGNKLKRVDQGTGGGAGTNESGFSALLAGYRYADGTFNYLGQSTDIYYMGTESINNCEYFTLGREGNYIYNYGPCGQYEALSVRCIKD